MDGQPIRRHADVSVGNADFGCQCGILVRQGFAHGFPEAGGPCGEKAGGDTRGAMVPLYEHILAGLVVFGGEVARGHLRRDHVLVRRPEQGAGRGVAQQLRHRDKLLLIVQATYRGVGGSFPCFRAGEHTIEALRQRFQPDMTQQQYARFASNLIDNSLANWRTDAYDCVSGAAAPRVEPSASSALASPLSLLSDSRYGVRRRLWCAFPSQYQRCCLGIL